MTEDHARVRCYAEDKARINELRQGTETQADVIRRLLDGEGDTAAPEFGDGIRELTEATKADIERVRADLEAMDTDGQAGGPTFDDMKAACAAAIRDELGEVFDR